MNNHQIKNKTLCTGASWQQPNKQCKHNNIIKSSHISSHISSHRSNHIHTTRNITQLSHAHIRNVNN
jgi:hypothetical protein